MTVPGDALRGWASSGALALSGRADGPAIVPAHSTIRKLHAIGERITELTGAMGHPVEVDPPALVAERAALAGLQRAGDRSCGGSTRLLRTGDEWLAITLARDDDLALLPAWLEIGSVGGDPWEDVAALIASRQARSLVSRAELLGLPVSRYREARPSPIFDELPPAPRAETSTARLEHLLVVDLSSLWAGPLCADLLRRAGARVVKVEDTRRPDGARQGVPGFFDLLNAGKESVALDLGTPSGVDALRRLLHAADIVVEASRPRALQQLSLDAATILRTGRPRVWISITGHGRFGASGNRVAFGDDAAVAGGLVLWDDLGPVFCADAIADPATGLAAAVAALEALKRPTKHLIDVAMASVAAHLADDGSAEGGVYPAPQVCLNSIARPTASRLTGRGPALGEHTDSLLREFAGS